MVYISISSAFGSTGAFIADIRSARKSVSDLLIALLKTPQLRFL